jgi:hypothetical protein
MNKKVAEEQVGTALILDTADQKNTGQNHKPVFLFIEWELNLLTTYSFISANCPSFPPINHLSFFFD